MEPLLYLVHRIPFPPNKGDKVRSYHLLRFLRERYDVHLGCFYDNPQDAQYESQLSEWCVSQKVLPLQPMRARVRSLQGFARRRALSIDYYRDTRMSDWVEETVARYGIKKVLVFSSQMAQYVTHRSDLLKIVDFVDVDSSKWQRFAADHRWPMSWVYRREGRTLLEFERAVAQASRACLLCTDAESDLFRSLAPESAERVVSIKNGVDSQYFSPDPHRASPYPADSLPLVFTGAMDYWPNIDAVIWFARDIFPAIRARYPKAVFTIVGSHPSPQVQALHNGNSICVTGTVPDIRPYIQHGAVSVVPVRIARGIQNKVLEAMSMAKPVVVSQSCLQGLETSTIQAIRSANTAQDFIEACLSILSDPISAADLSANARYNVVNVYGWDHQLTPLTHVLGGEKHRPLAEAPAP